MQKRDIKSIFTEFITLTGATILLSAGIYVFRFQNNFTFGGVSGISMLIAALTNFTASDIMLILNIALLLLAFFTLGKEFAARSVYVTILYSSLISVFEKLFPMSQPLTDEPVIELVFAIITPAVASAILFHFDASSGGTDIIAMIIKKYTGSNIGTGLLVADALTVCCSFFVFGVKTGLFSLCGFLAKSLVIDTVIESINLCKYFNIVCTDPKPICDFICDELHRDATVYEAKGAFTNGDKCVVMTVMNRAQAIHLRNFIKSHEPTAFIMITNTSEIIGKGFRSL